MNNQEKLKELLAKKDNECGEKSIALRVAEEEYNDIKFLIDNGMTYGNVKQILHSTTSSSLYEFLLAHVAGSGADEYCRCTNKECPKKVGCLRSMLNTSIKPGRYAYSHFTCDDRDGWKFRIEV